jgi:hypothetical protein
MRHSRLLLLLVLANPPAAHADGAFIDALVRREASG